MNSTDKFINNLNEIIAETERYTNYSRAELFSRYINDKLAEALRTYQKDIDISSEYLLKQESTRVLKAITKIQKHDDKAAIEQQLENESSVED